METLGSSQNPILTAGQADRFQATFSFFCFLLLFDHQIFAFHPGGFTSLHVVMRIHVDSV